MANPIPEKDVAYVLREASKFEGASRTAPVLRTGGLEGKILLSALEEVFEPAAAEYAMNRLGDLREKRELGRQLTYHAVTELVRAIILGTVVLGAAYLGSHEYRAANRAKQQQTTR